MSRAGIEPFYFGTTKKPLFGCYHAPQSRSTRDCSVVLCYPMGQEYIRSHRAYRQLAIRLSNVGFHVLRFDFYGCGDSAGDCEQGQICQWLTDISTAIDEIRGSSGLVKVCLVGLRLGATLAMMVGAKRGDIEGLVLWDTVVSGSGYLEELTTLDREMQRLSYGKSERHIKGKKHTEILGFPLTDSLVTGIGKIDLLAITQKPAKNILVIDCNERAGEEQLKEHFKRIDTHLDYQHLPSPKIWIQDPYKALVPNQILKSVASWLCEVLP